MGCSCLISLKRLVGLRFVLRGIFAQGTLFGGAELMLGLLLFCFGLTFAGLGAVAFAFVVLMPSEDEQDEARVAGYCVHDYPVEIHVNN
jgi:hypothetical protein